MRLFFIEIQRIVAKWLLCAMRINLLLFLLFTAVVKNIAQDSLWTIRSIDFQTKTLSEGWMETICIGASFKLTMPGSFQLKSDSIDIDTGDLYVHNFYFHQKKDKTKGIETDLVFTLSIYDYPFLIPKDSTEILADFLMATVEAAAEGVKGELVYQSDIVLQKHEGKIWRIHYNEGNSVIRSKGFLLKNRLYLLSVATSKKYSLNEFSDKFFHSFRFLE